MSSTPVAYMRYAIITVYHVSTHLFILEGSSPDSGSTALTILLFEHNRSSLTALVEIPFPHI